MYIISDLLLFFSASFIFSISILCILLYIKAKDKYSKKLLTILIPLVLQTGINSIIVYLNKRLSESVIASENYSMFALIVTLSSIIVTTVLIYNLSRFLLNLLPVQKKERRIGKLLIYIFTGLFFFTSLFLILIRCRGDWLYAMGLTLNYHFPCASFLFVIHGIVTLFYLKKAGSREEESLLKGISMTFIPLLMLFPLDMIFFRYYSFKLSYLCFSVFTINIYFFISRFYFRSYEPNPEYIHFRKSVFRKFGLSEREVEIVNLVIKGTTNNDIAESLFISVNTVKTHIKNIYKKLSVSNRIQLIHMLQQKYDRPLKE